MTGTQTTEFKPFEIETTIEEGGEIHQTITDVTGKVLLHVLDTQEDGVRRALIEMGWTPPRQPLTDEEIIEATKPKSVWEQDDYIQVARAIEAAHGIKEQG